MEGLGEGSERAVEFRSGEKPARRETRLNKRGGRNEGEGGRDSAPLLKSFESPGVLLCNGAALDGDPREVDDSIREDLVGELLLRSSERPEQLRRNST